jgi:hypothetical protein
MLRRVGVKVNDINDVKKKVNIFNKKKKRLEKETESIGRRRVLSRETGKINPDADADADNQNNRFNLEEDSKYIPSNLTTDGDRFKRKLPRPSCRDVIECHIPSPRIIFLAIYRNTRNTCSLSSCIGPRRLSFL